MRALLDVNELPWSVNARGIPTCNTSYAVQAVPRPMEPRGNVQQ
jgi:hypothetical protein